MNTYTFSTINDKDFEVLVLDLLNFEYDLGLQDFKVGKDGGVDLRYSTLKNDNSIIVQAKHYLKTDYKKLIYNLKKEELDKVKKLNPDRYIVATSLELSKDNKDEIKSIFSPYILTANDVYGRNDLNRLLRKHKEVEKKHFKLWFSSTEIISNILNNAIEGRTKSYLERIKYKVPLYVLTANFDLANKKLVREKILLITGQPGVGKTTLAEVMLYEKAKTKHKVYLINTIREAEDVISPNDKEKQVFYFDDFLGEVYYEIIAGSQKESEISNFVDRIKHTPNKFIILSTRTVILEQAKSKSEKIKRSRIETGKYEIVLDSYTNLEKARILYNHLFFQALNVKFFEAIIEDKLFMWIINHKNYTPRIIEFITLRERIKAFSKYEFREFVKRNLEHPEEIWNDSYQNQINYFDRCLLQTIFTFPRGINENKLRLAFEKRLKHEKKINNKQISCEQFNLSIKNILHGFVLSSIVNVDDNIKHFNFINPSISDFLISFLNKNYSIKKAIVESIIFLEQLEIFAPDNGKFEFEVELQNIVESGIKNNKYDSLDQYKDYKFTGYKLEILIRFCKDVQIDETLVRLLKEIDLKNIWWIRKGFEYTLENISGCPKSKRYIEENFPVLISNYIPEIDEPEKASKIPSFFKKFGHNFSSFSKRPEGQNILVELITKLTTDKEKSLMETYKDDVADWEDYDSFVYSQISDLKVSLSKNLLPKDVAIEIPKYYEKEDLEEQLQKNKIERKEAAKRVSDMKDMYTEITNKTKVENQKIHDLFHLNNLKR